MFSGQMAKVLRKETINANVTRAQYAVRGLIPQIADGLSKELRQGKDLGFDKVVYCNIGNPQQLEQAPLTFLRQVAALTEYPALLESPEVSKLFPTDAQERAKILLQEATSVGAYSHSQGLPLVREHVAKFIEERDGGIASDSESIFLTAGASGGVTNLMMLMLTKPSDGMMIPIPQYPLYTANLALYNARPAPYYLDEKNEWALELKELERSYKEAQDNGTDVKALVVINPGNPTGGVLSEENMREVVQFCYDKGLVLLADEVYQTNIYQDDREFVSFKKVLKTMPEAVASQVELISFHSLSKGSLGECGRRGGYFELVNILDEAKEQIYKLASIQLCPPVSGQIAVDVLVNPPKPGDPSYGAWKSENAAIHDALNTRAVVLCEKFSKLPGIVSNDAQGAMYLFPQIQLPPKAVAAAEAEGLSPDTFYAKQLLLATGICVVPGSGFGQVDGTFHFRTTFLAPGIDDYADRFAKFHEDFFRKYA